MANHCPDCKEVLLPGAVSCACGWKAKDATKAQIQKPTIDGLIKKCAAILTKIEIERYPSHFPRDPEKATMFWLNEVIRPEKEKERPFKRINRKTSNEYWKWPYAERAELLLNIFLRQRPEYQDLIVAAAEDGIHWNGEAEDFFCLVIKNSGDGYQGLRKTGTAND